MRQGNPLLPLHEALAAALLRDLPVICYQTTDWRAVDKLRKKLSAAEYNELRAQGKLPSKKAERRPTEEDVDVQLFPQLWGSTALGYGGVGGAAMTSAYTVVVATREVACVYFGGGRLAYAVPVAKLKPAQLEAWQQHLACRNLPDRTEAHEAYGPDTLPKEETDADDEA